MTNHVSNGVWIHVDNQIISNYNLNTTQYKVNNHKLKHLHAIEMYDSQLKFVHGLLHVELNQDRLRLNSSQYN